MSVLLFVNCSDRISQLPDDILVYVLSFLSLKEAARTSVLSSRWINLSKHNPRLVFDAHSLPDRIAKQKGVAVVVKWRKYVKWVNCILRSHRAATLKEFAVFYELNRLARNDITRWLEFAFARNVETLELDLSRNSDYFGYRHEHYVFPEEYFLNGSIDFKSLKVLSLRSVEVTDGAVEFFLRNCPLLEELAVEDSYKISNLEVCGRSLCAKKRYQHSDVDRISQLPDDILVTIVSSFLSLKEAARTSVLSSRWINLWKHIPCLNFDAEQKRLWDEKSAKELLGEERRKYVEWVNSVLTSHKEATLNEYRISFDLCRSTGEPVNRWLEFAFSRRVRILELDLSPTIMNWRPWSKTYAFPEELLTRTSGGASILEPASCIDFKSLKALSMRFVNVSGEAIEFFLRTCPFLEKLVVHNASELSNLEVCGSSLDLKHLELQSCHNLTSIKVSAPNLTSLTLPNVKGLLLENVPMLVEVSVSCVLFMSLSDCDVVYSIYSGIALKDNVKNHTIRIWYTYPSVRLSFERLHVTSFSIN
ncbi:hypothetical protein MIMGU_mgv1a020578mg [Erythranthe guttata]|uniref:F-box domain-containing protein n=1 Tax=Erythranthe guttata TaxID=4155 RepID=A0A022RMZ1_ERYGU|nr:hypothetical protein MIMGU_mgv1a020578mg [Erythranthe guttata]